MHVVYIACGTSYHILFSPAENAAAMWSSTGKARGRLVTSFSLSSPVYLYLYVISHTLHNHCHSVVRMRWTREVMADSTVVEGQFEDAEEVSRENVEEVPRDERGESESFSSGEELGDDWDFDWEDETGDFTKRYNAIRRGQAQANRNAPSDKLRESSSKSYGRRLESKINLGAIELPGHDLSSAASSSLAGASRKADESRAKHKDKSDRATSEQVLDPRTRMILFKLLSRGTISEIHGCVSTGKEANVYYATGLQQGCAVKVYKTSILVFKDRDKYVTGEFRFRHGYARHNPRKMVRLWAEKEMRNLTRLHNNGIPCPQPILLRSHVLVMSFLGVDGWPSPKLKDARLSEGKARELYYECVLHLRNMYQRCKLVHADLSEYNMLVHEGRLYIIDVSQSVEHDHPHALEFLRKDCSNVTEFFRRNRVCVMSVKELFDFVTDVTLADDRVDEYLKRAEEKAIMRQPGDNQAEDKVSEAVFKQIFIPRTLAEVAKFEEDFENMQIGRGQDIAYSTVTGLKPDLSGAQSTPALLQENGRHRESGEEGRGGDKSESEERSAADNMVGGLEVGSDAELSEDSSEEEEDKSERDQISPYIHPRGKLKGGEYCASVRDVQCLVGILQVVDVSFV